MADNSGPVLDTPLGLWSDRSPSFVPLAESAARVLQRDPMPSHAPSNRLSAPQRFLGCFLWLGCILWAFATAAGAVEVAPPSDQSLLDDTRIIEVVITLPAEDWEKLRNESRDPAKVFGGDTVSPFTYRRGDVVVDGFAIDGVGIRKKGLFGSLDSGNPSLLVDFNRFVDQNPLEGLGRLTLNNNKQDASLISQYLAYKLFRAAGLAAPRVGFANVTVNGEALGIYSNVESVKKPFLKRSFGDGSGALYEGTICDILPEALARLEVQGNETPLTKRHLADLAGILAATEPLDVERLGEVVDVDWFIRFWALESLLNVWDGYAANQNNYFFYATPRDGLFRFIPWGADATVGSMPGFGGPFGGNRTPPAVFAQAALANRLYFSPGIADRYRAELERLLETVWKEEDLLADVDRLEHLLTPRLGSRQSGGPKAMQSVRDYIGRRRGEITAALENWPAEAPETYRKPMTTEPLGTASGSFSATYRDGAIDDVPPAEVELELLIGDDVVELTEVEASVSTFMFPTFGGGGGPPADPPMSVVISAKRVSDDKPIALNLFVDRRRIRENDPQIPLNGMLTEGTSGFGMPGFGPMRSISGTLEPMERGTDPGSIFSGRFDLKIVQMRGGLMNSAPLRKPGVIPE